MVAVETCVRCLLFWIGVDGNSAGMVMRVLLITQSRVHTLSYSVIVLCSLKGTGNDRSALASVFMCRFSKVKIIEAKGCPVPHLWPHHWPYSYHHSLAPFDKSHSISCLPALLLLLLSITSWLNESTAEVKTSKYVALVMRQIDQISKRSSWRIRFTEIKASCWQKC